MGESFFRSESEPSGRRDFSNQYVLPPDPQPGVRFANPGRRFGAILIDWVAPWIVLTLSNNLIGYLVVAAMVMPGSNSTVSQMTSSPARHPGG